MTFAIKNMLFAAAVLVPAAFTTHAAVAQSAETFTISNESSYRIDHVYMTYSNYDRWGKDVLYGYLHPDHQLDLQVHPGTYDVRVVDQYGNACVIGGVDVYEDEVWTLTNAKLTHCERVTSN